MPIGQGGAASVPGGLVRLFDSVLSGAAASIDTGANGIVQTSANLLVVFVGRTTEAVTGSTVRFTLNNDSGTNYGKEVLGGANAVASAAITGGAAFWSHSVPGASFVANVPGTVQFLLPSYTGTTFHKTAMAMIAFVDAPGTSGNAFVAGDTWANTAAVTRLAVAAGSGNLVAGSRLTIFGLG